MKINNTFRYSKHNSIKLFINTNIQIQTSACIRHTHTYLSALTFTHPGKSNVGKVILVLKGDRCQKTSRKITTIIFCLATAALKILICNYSFHL